MPKAAALSRALLVAAKWRATSVPPWERNQALAASALARVSCVVKVLLATMKSVRCASSWGSTAARSWPSTLETKCRRRPGLTKGWSA